MDDNNEAAVDINEFDPYSSPSSQTIPVDDPFQLCPPKPPPRRRPPPPPPVKAEDITLVDETREQSVEEDEDQQSGDFQQQLSRQSEKGRSLHPHNATSGSSRGQSSVFYAQSFSSEASEVSEARKNREEYLHAFMERREEEYTIKKKINVFVGSWNVNGKSPTESLRAWLSTESVNPDLYFIGFQELDLSKEAFVFTESARESEWIEKIKEALNPKPRYQLIKHVRLIGMMLVLFASENNVRDIHNVAIRHVGTGLLGKMGNKGGVGIRLDFKNSSLCVVNSHLAAHTENIRRRNQDYQDIKSRMKFNVNYNEYSLFDHDILVWLGDLNYRIEGLVGSEVRRLADDPTKYNVLQRHDQLTKERGILAVFEGFTEGPINFKPTYKYDPGTDNWDTSEKLRLPAWCDRILWWEKIRKSKIAADASSAPVATKPSKYVKQLTYRTHLSLRLSDHKPISSHFEFDIKVIDNASYKTVLEEEMRRLDKMENDTLPSAKISNHMIDFGEVRFQREAKRSITITNTGQHPCTFEFITKPDINAKCKPWLTMIHPTGLLMPEESMQIEFAIYINQFTAPALNSGKESLDDILVLHLHNGKDFFVTISGKYIPSSFGTPLSVLSRMNRPIQEYSMKEIKELNKDAKQGSLMQSIPKELWKLVDHLYTLSKEEEDLFQQPGLHEEVQNIREFIDTTPVTSNKPLPGSNHSVAEALLIFLASLPQPVIPYENFNSCVDALNSDHRKESISKAIENLPQTHRLVFEYILVFLRELPLYPGNRLTKKLIAEIFSNHLLPVPPSIPSYQLKVVRKKSTEFLEQCILLGS